jgi:tetratricopeptide (TPR) repeat protein
VHPRDAIRVADAAVRRALALDSLSPEAHVALAAVAHSRLDWATAERIAQRAVQLDSLNPIAHWQLGFAALNHGDVSLALRAFQRSRALDPMFATAVFYLGLTEVLSGQTAQGVRNAVLGHELAPALPSGQSVLLLTLMTAGENARAAAYAAQFAERTDDPFRLGMVALALRRGGKVTQAAALERRIEEAPDDVRGVWNGRFLARLGTRDDAGALDAMERAGAGDGDLLQANVLISPIFDGIRAQPRFQAALTRFHLDDSPIGRGLATLTR